jgi:hypothetical protein
MLKKKNWIFFDYIQTMINILIIFLHYVSKVK